MHLLRGKPSPAMVVAVCALAFAMVGTAVAGTDGLNEKLSKSKVKKIAKKQANKVLDSREASLNVNSAKTADNATNATNADNANTVGGVGVGALTVGRSDDELDCFGDATPYTCASFTMNLPRAGRVLLVSQLPMHPDADASSARCDLTRNGANIPGTETHPGALVDNISNQDSEVANGGSTVVTGVLPAGNSTFAQVCADTGGNPHFRHSTLSAVLLGSD